MAGMVWQFHQNQISPSRAETLQNRRERWARAARDAMSISLHAANGEGVAAVFARERNQGRCECRGCCTDQKFEMYGPDGQTCGTIVRESTWCTPVYNAEESAKHKQYRVKGPKCRCESGDKYKILDNGAESGVIEKVWSNYAQENFTDADNYKITFPPMASEISKAILIGVAFFIDFEYYENMDVGGGEQN